MDRSWSQLTSERCMSSLAAHANVRLSGLLALLLLGVSAIAKAFISYYRLAYTKTRIRRRRRRTCSHVLIRYSIELDLILRNWIAYIIATNGDHRSADPQTSSWSSTIQLICFILVCPHAGRLVKFYIIQRNSA